MTDKKPGRVAQGAKISARNNDRRLKCERCGAVMRPQHMRIHHAFTCVGALAVEVAADTPLSRGKK